VYQITDYKTDKAIFTGFKTREEAGQFAHDYKKKCIKGNVVHNNLLLIDKVQG
jgi:hypothetical protein